MTQVWAPSKSVVSADLPGLYDRPNQIVLDKAKSRLDEHSSGFLRAARLAILSLRDMNGQPAPTIVGTEAGAMSVTSPTTIELPAPDDDQGRAILAAATPMDARAGFLFIVPGVEETLRMKGRCRMVQTPEGRHFLQVEIETVFFHCAKAFMRSRVWQGATPAEAGIAAGPRSFRCIRKVEESAVISSFFFVPDDGGTLPDFKPGQHVALNVELPDGASVWRRYSLSNRPGQGELRISVKREADTAIVSRHLHDRIGVGSVVRLRRPAGDFVLCEASERPVVLLSAGVGLTPMISMLDHLAATSRRQIWFFHAAISGLEHAMGEHVRTVAREHANVHVHIHYERPRRADRAGVDYDAVGRLSVADLKRCLPWDDYEFYVCGPGPFMTALIGDLLANGILRERIRWEAFSGNKLAVVSGTAAAPEPAGAVAAGDLEVSAGIEIVFRRSGKTLPWTSRHRTILELADANGIAARSSCRTGECFSCGTRVISGAVTYTREMKDLPDDGTALICSAVPKANLVLDL